MSLKQASYTITALETAHMTNSRRNIIVALEDLNFIWCEDEANEAAEMWRAGIPLDLIASNFGRSVDDTFALLWDLARKNKIKLRPGGVFGREINA